MPLYIHLCASGLTSSEPSKTEFKLLTMQLLGLKEGADVLS